MAFNWIKTKEDIVCPECGKSTRQSYLQSKHMLVNGEPPNVYNQDWYKIEDVTEGEMHGKCVHCKSQFQFNIKDGQITGHELRR